MYRNWLTSELALIGLEQEALTNSDSTPLLALYILGRPEEVVAAAEKYLAEDPIGPWSRLDLGLALAAAGDYTRARPILEDMWQQSEARGPLPVVFTGNAAAALFAIRRDADKKAEVLVAMRDDVHRLRSDHCKPGSPAAS